MGKRRSFIGRDDIEVIAIFKACSAGYYDTRMDFSVEEEEPHITFKRLLRLFLPDGSTHQFAIQVDKTGYKVTRYPNSWTVEFDDKTEEQRRERRLRNGALEIALRYFSEKVSGRVLEDYEVLEFVDTLLNEDVHPDLWNKDFSGHHPIVRDESPVENKRCWSVTIGSHHCSVGLVKDTPEPEFTILP